MKNIIPFTLVSILTLACGMPNGSNSTTGSLSLDPETTITYGMIKSEILNAKCINCHSDLATEEGLKKKITPGEPDASPFFTMTENGSMPKGGAPLTTSQLEMIRMYITQMNGSSSGSTNTPVPAPAPAPGSGSVAYNQLREDVLEPKCMSCHSFVGTEAGLKNWVTPGKPETSKLFMKTQSGEMPKGGTPLSQSEMELITKYITQLSSLPASPAVDDSKDGITFKEVKARILDPYSCTNCHDINSEADFDELDIDKAYEMTKSGEMPQGGSRLTKEDQAYLLQYMNEFENR